jgi:hypothetical protein
MDSLAYSMLKQKIMSQKASDFQNTIDTIYGIVYEKSFVPVKQKRDKGSDGFVNSDTSLALYAPERYQLADFRKKTKSDFEKYRENWQSQYPHWNVLTNLENTGEMISHINGLYQYAELVSVTSICDLIRNQTWSKIARIFKSLDLPESYLSYDLFSMIIDDLSRLNGVREDYTNPVYIKEKIEINISNDSDRTSFIDEYENYLPEFGIIQRILGEYDSCRIDSLRSRILTVFQMTSGDFLHKFSTTVLMLSATRSNDDYYCLHVRKLLFYFFEQCLIGLKVKTEIKNAKS